MNRVPINAQLFVLFTQKLKKTHSFRAKRIPGAQGKSSQNCNMQKTPEKQKEPPTLWNWRFQGPLAIKISGNSE